MLASFGYFDAITKLGDYCRACLSDDGRKTRDPAAPNKTFAIYRRLRLTEELISIFDELEVFKMAATSGYRLREEPHLIRWTYHGNNQGSADHYHHDWHPAHKGQSGQVSLMLLLEENFGKTHMRIIPDSRSYFGRYLYDFIRAIPNFRGRGRLFKLNDFLIELFHNPVRLEGPQDKLYYFNSGNSLHKAVPIKGTTRTIFHLNLTPFETFLSSVELESLNTISLSPLWKSLLLDLTKSGPAAPPSEKE
jgi:hypothetical protein